MMRVRVGVCVWGVDVCGVGVVWCVYVGVVVCVSVCDVCVL